jgi:hypothetical protein
VFDRNSRQSLVKHCWNHPQQLDNVNNDASDTSDSSRITTSWSCHAASTNNTINACTNDKWRKESYDTDNNKSKQYRTYASECQFKAKKFKLKGKSNFTIKFGLKCCDVAKCGRWMFLLIVHLTSKWMKVKMWLIEWIERPWNGNKIVCDENLCKFVESWHWMEDLTQFVNFITIWIIEWGLFWMLHLRKQLPRNVPLFKKYCCLSYFMRWLV